MVLFYNHIPLDITGVDKARFLNLLFLSINLLKRSFFAEREGNFAVVSTPPLQYKRLRSSLESEDSATAWRYSYKLAPRGVYTSGKGIACFFNRRDCALGWWPDNIQNDMVIWTIFV